MDVGNEKSLMTSNNDIPGNLMENFSTNGDWVCKGASGAITYLKVDNKDFDQINTRVTNPNSLRPYTFVSQSG